MGTSRRVNISKQHSSTYKALTAVSAAADEAALAAGINQLLIELVKIRTSEINGCAYCLRVHVRDAIKNGETTDRLAVLSAWRETTYFSEQERAALALTESITRITETRIADEDYEFAASILDDDQLSAIAWLSTVMGSFNRVGVMSRYEVAPAKVL